jgi:hypothetical protein
VFPRRFFAPRLFPPRYYPLGGASAVDTTTGRDFNILAEAKALLSDTGVFGGIYLVPPEEHQPTEAPATMAFLALASGRAETEGDGGFDDGDVDLIERHEFLVTLVVTDEDAGRRARKLARLVAVAKSALDGQGLGTCLPEWTLVHRWEYLLAKAPWKAARLRLRAAQLLDGYADHNADNDIDDMS